MLDGHLVFTANGANAKGQPTVYWFAINSEVAVPKNPGKEPEKPTAQFHPLLQLHRLWKLFQMLNR